MQAAPDSSPLPLDIAQRLRTDLTTRAAYVSDASIYRRVPAAVLEPESIEDIRAGLLYAKKRNWSVTMRGGGTSVAGNAIGEGLVIDTSRHFNQILAIDADARVARIQPGVVCDQLRKACAEFGLTYGPDPSTHSRCTVGGMVANNACGSHSLAWGTAADNLVSLRVMLPSGKEVTLTATGADDDQINKDLLGLRDGNLALIRKEIGRFPRQVSGYGLHYLLPEKGFDVAKAFAGSEGTCGIITELTVKLVAKPRATALAVLAFETIIDAAIAAPQVRRPGVTTAEGMGSDLVQALQSRPGQEDAGRLLPGMETTRKAGAATPGGWLFCETVGDSSEEAEAVANSLLRELSNLKESPAISGRVVTDPAHARSLWRIRETSAGIVTRLPDGGEAWPSWEDSAVPPENLGDYLRGLYALMAQYDLTGIPFGHFGEGCVHVRISFDLDTEAGLKTFRSFMESAADLVSKHGGSLSGEHGDGRARSELLGRMYSPGALEAFRQFKLVFDPDSIFNPGVLVQPERIDDRIRPGQEQRTHELIPIHALSRDGGSLVGAVNRCVGVGLCRSDEGAMCPSFQATGNEVDSTRGRSRVLSEMFRGETLPSRYKSEEVKEALDLCLSCKACASECPVNVDMATYKSEFLYRFYERRIRPMAHYSMGWLPILASVMHRIPGMARIANASLSIPLIETLVKRLGGIDATQPMINFAETSLQSWNARRHSADKIKYSTHTEESSAGPTVVLWPDTFSNHLDTTPGEAAIEVMEALGYRVIVPGGFLCCGLTWHSTGQLDVARKVLLKTLTSMRPYLESGFPIVGLEPSCSVMLTKDILELLPNNQEAKKLAASMISFGALVERHLPVDEASRRAWPFGELDVGAVSQVHCHERSHGDHSPASRVLSAIGVAERQIETGCCGLAGNWGFEPGHASLSETLGERELFPAVRQRPERDLVMADGFSCRTQISIGTGVAGMHLAEVLLAAQLPEPSSTAQSVSASLNGPQNADS